MVLPFKPQKAIPYNQHLPYHEKLDDEAISLLADIKVNLSQAVCFHELTPGILVWCNRLDSYLSLYGRNFSKDDHLHFIKLLYQLMVIPNLEPQFVKGFASVLHKLLKKQDLLSQDELQLEWRPLYELAKSVKYSKETRLGLKHYPHRYMETINSVVKVARAYFTVESTKEMLIEWRPLLCPFDAVKANAAYYFSHFLPTCLPKEHHDKGFRMWFEELFEYWLHCTKNIPSVCEEYAKLFMRLAENNIGYIDWNKKIAKICNHFLSKLELPINGKQLSSSKLSVNVYAKWFVYMLGGSNDLVFSDLQKIFKSLESFYHPSNYGRYSIPLLSFLHSFTDHFIQRLHKERHAKKSWLTCIPDEFKITDTEVANIVKMLKDISLMSIYSKSGSLHAASILKNLSLLCPELVLPELIEKVSEAMETLVEPHQVTATLTCLTSVARMLASGGDGKFPAGPTHILPLLYQVLPGIDSNDFRKSMASFTLISAFVGVIPIVDCSDLVNDGTEMTDIEKELCIATANFEDFVLQFIDRCLVLIENSSTEEVTEKDSSNMRVDLNMQEGMLGMGLASTVQIVLNQCSPSIFKPVLQCMFSFVSTRVLEVNVAGKMVSDMCRSAAKACPAMTLEMFLPFICSRVSILATIEGAQDEEQVDGELLWYLELLSELLQCNGKVVIQYKDSLKKTLSLTLHMKCRKAYTRAGKILKSILSSCSEVYPLEWWSQHMGFSKPPNEHFYIRDWGKTTDLKDLNMKWHIPDDNELKFIDEILKDVLIVELDTLNGYVNGNSMSRDELHQRLHLIAFVLYGCGNILPQLNGNKVEGLAPFTLVKNQRQMNTTNCSKVQIFQPCVSRNDIALRIHELLVFLHEKHEDDAKAFKIISKILNCLIRNFGVNWSEFNFRWKNASSVKKALCDKLHGNKVHIRTILVERVRLQHDMRVLDRYSSTFTDMDQMVVDDLLQLGLSDYAEVRIESQQNLFSALEIYDYSARYILPKLLSNLEKASDVSHETFKGTLYILQCSRIIYLVTHYWEVMVKAWPCIVKSGHSEKPSIVMLLQKLLMKLASNFDTLGLERKVSDQCIEQAQVILLSTEPPSLSSTDNKGNIIAEEKLQEAVQRRDSNNVSNERFCFNLIEELTTILCDSSLHWRTLETCMKFLTLLINGATSMPDKTVQIVSEMVIHDSRVMRTNAINIVMAVLHQHKPVFSKISLNYDIIQMDNSDMNLLSLQPGDMRKDIELLQFDWNKKPKSQDDFDKLLLIEKTHIGYQTWPKNIEIYSNNTNVYSCPIPNQGTIILDKLSDDKFIDAFIGFLSIENKKGEDRFSSKRYQFFKGVFRNFGNTNKLVEKYLAVIRKLLKDDVESCHRCASEIIAGLIRGSKNWHFDEKATLLKDLIPMLKDVISRNIIPEMIRDWAVMLISSTESLDPHRFHDLYEMLLDNPLSGKGGAFSDSTRLFLLQNTIAQQEWRVASINHGLLTYLMSHLSHPFKNVRDQIGSLLSYIFLYDLKYGGFTDTHSPRLDSFLESIVGRLEEVCADTLIRVDDTKTIKNNDEAEESLEVETKRKSNDCFIKTILVFLQNLCHHSMQPITKRVISIIPLLIPLESREDDPEIVDLCKKTFPMMASKEIPLDVIDYAIESILEVCRSQSWNCRKTSLNFLKIVLINNLFTCNKKILKENIQGIILDRLQDEKLEVREIASNIYSGLIHYGFLSIDANILEYFSGLSRKVMKKKRGGVNLSIEDQKENTKISHIKHAGILGLSACILAYPYQVPDWLPNIILHVGSFLHEAPHIVASVKKTLSEFRRTHHDNWHVHRQKFTDDQLVSLTDLLVSPSYYA